MRAIAFGQTPLVSVVIGRDNHLGALTLSSNLRCHSQAVDALIGCLTFELLLEYILRMYFLLKVLLLHTVSILLTSISQCDIRR